jgi:hypothetical protein
LLKQKDAKAHSWKEKRGLNRNRQGYRTHLFRFPKRIISPEWFAKTIAPYLPDDDSKTISRSDAAKELGLPLGSLESWEPDDPKRKKTNRCDCHYLGSRLTVVRDHLCQMSRSGPHQRLVWRENAKKYLQSEIDQIKLLMAKQTAAGGFGVYVDQRGQRWMRHCAAERKDAKYCWARLRWLAEHDHIDKLELPRLGWGRGPTVDYFREDGERGFVANFSKCPPLNTILAERGYNKASASHEPPQPHKKHERGPRTEGVEAPEHTQDNKRKRGPEPKQSTIDVQEYCYRRLKAGDKRAAIAAGVRDVFKREVFTPPMVSTYASRYESDEIG